MTICVIPCNRLLFYGSKLTLILLYATPDDDILSGGVVFDCFHRNIYEIIATRGGNYTLTTNSGFISGKPR